MDQELLDYFAVQEQPPIIQGPSENELSGIVIHIEEIIDCLMTLIPSVRGAAAQSLTVRIMSTQMESLDDLKTYVMLIQRQFPDIYDVIILRRLAESLSWRRKRLRQLPESSSSKKHSTK